MEGTRAPTRFHRRFAHEDSLANFPNQNPLRLALLKHFKTALNWQTYSPRLDRVFVLSFGAFPIHSLKLCCIAFVIAQRPQAFLISRAISRTWPIAIEILREFILMTLFRYGTRTSTCINAIVLV